MDNAVEDKKNLVLSSFTKLALFCCIIARVTFAQSETQITQVYSFEEWDSWPIQLGP